MENQIFSNILVFVDGSPFSVRAQEFAALIAKKFNSKVTVIHVVAHELMHPQLQGFSPETPEIVTAGVRMQASPWVRVPEPGTSSVVKEVSNIYRQEGEDVIADASIFFKEEGISVNQRLLEHADPAEAAIKEAQKESCDLIVMGRSSGEDETKPHLGSTAAKVTAHSQIPVLVSAGRSRISKILAPIDGSEASEKSVDYGSALAKMTNAEMTLLYVQESRLFGLRPEVTKKIGTDALSNAAQRVKGVRFDQKLESGDVANTIIQVADKGDYDLIVMGGKGHSSVRNFFLGGVSNHVLHYVDRAILIVK